MNRTWCILLWLIGEAILIAAFTHFGLNDKQSYLILYLIVSTIILTVISVSFVNKKDRSAKKRVGKGMKWFFTLTYAFLAIAAMFYFGFINPVDLLTQVIIQLIVLSVLFMGMWGAFKPVKKTESNNKYQKLEQHQLMMIRNSIEFARAKAEKRRDIPVGIVNGIKVLQDEANSISPGNEYVALKMEGRIMLEINQIVKYLREDSVDLKRLQATIKYCSKLFNEFRGTYSMHQAHQFS